MVRWRSHSLLVYIHYCQFSLPDISFHYHLDRIRGIAEYDDHYIFTRDEPDASSNFSTFEADLTDSALIFAHHRKLNMTGHEFLAKTQF